MNYKQVMSKGSRISDSGIDKWHDFTDNDRQLCESNTRGIYYVIARDKFMSGWGGAEGRTSYFVEVCWSSTQANYAEEAISQASEMRNVRVVSKLPTRLNGHVSVYNFDYSARFNKEYFWNISKGYEKDNDIVPHDSDKTQKTNVSDSRKRVKDGEENGIPCTYYYDLTLDLVNPNTDDRSEPYERLDPEHYVDFKDQEGWDNFDDCYDAAINRAMEYYFEGVESFSDDPDIDVAGVSVYIGHVDEGDDYNEEDYTCNLYPKGDEEYFAEHKQFIIV